MSKTPRATTRRLIEIGILAVLAGCAGKPDLPSPKKSSAPESKEEKQAIATPSRDRDESHRNSEPGIQPVGEGGQMMRREAWPAGMVPVYAGTFVADRKPANAGRPQHDLLQSSGSLWVDRTEVTVAAYSRCVAARKCRKPSGHEGQCNFGSANKGDHPINCVSQEEALAYCAWVGKRLPSSIEWKYAALGGATQREYPWGNESPLGHRRDDGVSEPGPARSWLCWDGQEVSYDDLPPPVNYSNGTCPVATFLRGDSHWNISDMAGNVWEWLPVIRDFGTKQDAEICGGGWRAAYPLNDLRFNAFNLAVCMPVDAKFTSDDIGFRCAKDWTP
jgi:formylglycine-generating enzyme required for sulfatase activity